MDFIERLRQKPARTRKTIAFATSAVVTLMIFGVWASVLHFGINSKPSNVTAAAGTATNGSNTDVNPFSAFWSVLSTGWNGLSNNINQIKTGVGDAKNFVNTLDTASSTNANANANVTVAPSPKPISPAINFVESPVVPSAPKPAPKPAPQTASNPTSQNDVFILSGTSTNDGQITP